MAQAEPAVLARQARQVHRAWQALPEGPVELAGLVVLEPREQPGRAALPELLGHLALPVERAELVEPEAWDLQVQRAQRE